MPFDMWAALKNKLGYSDPQIIERGRVGAYQRDISPQLKGRFNSGEFKGYMDIPDDAQLNAGAKFTPVEKNEMGTRDMANAQWGLEHPQQADENFANLTDYVDKRPGTIANPTPDPAVAPAPQAPETFSKEELAFLAELMRTRPEIFQNPDSQRTIGGKRYNQNAYHRYDTDMADDKRVDGAYNKLMGK